MVTQGSLSALRVLRVLRVARILRLLRFFRPLWLLVIGAGTAFCWCFKNEMLGKKHLLNCSEEFGREALREPTGERLPFLFFFWCATFLRVLGINGDSVHRKARIWKASLHSAFTCIYNASHLLGTTLHFRYLQIVGSWILCFLFVAGPGARGPVQVQWTPWELCCGHGRLGVFQDVQKRRSFFHPCVKFG